MREVLQSSRRMTAVLVPWLLLHTARATAAPVPQRELLGVVFHVGTHDEEVLEEGVQVILADHGAATVTNDHGFFRLPIPNFLQPGDAIRINAIKEGWGVRYPLGGEERVPDEPEKQLVRIELLPTGSPLFMTSASIEKMIQDAIQKSAQEVNLSKQGRAKFDFSRAVREWAQRFGLSAETARLEIDDWIAEVQNVASSTEHQRGLAAFAQEQFKNAAAHFGAAAEANLVRLAQLEADHQKIKAEEIASRRAAVSYFSQEGLAHYNSFHFEEALTSYEIAIQQLSNDEAPLLLASLLDASGNTLRKLGISTARKGEIFSPEISPDSSQPIKWNSRSWSVYASRPVATALAQGPLDQSLRKLAQLIDSFAERPPEIEDGLAFRGTLHFLLQEPGLSHRGLLIDLFEALAEPDHASVLASLRRLHDQIFAQRESAKNVLTEE